MTDTTEGLKIFAATEHCLSCKQCTILRPGRKKRHYVHPCTGTLKLHESEGKSPGASFRLFTVLYSITPTEIWKKWKPRWKEATHRRPKLEIKEEPEDRISRTFSLYAHIRGKLKSNAQLRSESPSMVTQAVHGPNVLLRPPILPPIPKAQMSLEGLEKLEQYEVDKRATRLAGQRNCTVGGIENRLYDLKKLEPIPVPEKLSETEPLRAMSLKEVTNIPLLKAHEKAKRITGCD